MAIDFKDKIASLRARDSYPLNEEELGYVKQIEDYIDSEIEKKLSTDNSSVYIDAAYVRFSYNHLTKKPLPSMTNSRKKFLQEELLSRYEKANWSIDWHKDDGLDDPDYLILKGKLN